MARHECRRLVGSSARRLVGSSAHRLVGSSARRLIGSSARRVLRIWMTVPRFLSDLVAASGSGSLLQLPSGVYDVWCMMYDWCFYAMFSGRCHVSHGCWLHPQWQLLMTRSILGACRKGVSFLILGWPALQTALKAGDCKVVKRKSWFLCKDFFSIFQMCWRCFWSHGSPVISVCIAALPLASRSWCSTLVRAELENASSPLYHWSR